MAPISNDLMLAAALTSITPAALAQTTLASNTPRTGVATTITSNAARGATSSTMYIDNATNQRLTTDANSTLHVLFADQSALTIGPNSELVIAKYEFDNKAKNGQILIDMTKGFLRVVGGLISKKNEAVVRTSTATIGIRGGISTVGVQPGGGGQPGQPGGQTTATFLFGQQMTVSSATGGPNQSITRPGFGITSSVVGLGPAVRVATTELSPSQAPAPAPPPTVAGSPAPAPGPAPAPAPSGPASVQITGLINNLSSTRLNDSNTVNTAALNTGGGGINPRPALTFFRAVIGRPNLNIS